MPENVLKLTYSNLEFRNFPGRTPGPPLQGYGREWRGGEGGDREGRGGTRREGGREGRNGGRGGEGGVQMCACY